jgi:hypothetical protein
MKLKNKLAVLCVTGFALLLISTAALADLPAVHNGPPSPEMMKEMLANPWSVEFITADGQYSRIAGYPSKEACEAAIPKVLREQGGYNGHCVYDDWSSGRIIGSQDPDWDGRDYWFVEFHAVDGRYSREGGYHSKEACDAAIPKVLQKEGGYNGHCIERKDGHFIGSQDPAWAGRDQWAPWAPWVIEFNAMDGKYRRIGVGFPSKDACESAIPFQVRMQGGNNGHCIQFKDGDYVGSHDPALAGK